MKNQVTEAEKMRDILNLCEAHADTLGPRGARTIDEIYDGVINDYKSEYFEAMLRDKTLPNHISKRHTGNVKDQAWSDMVTQVAFEYGVDQATAEDMSMDFALEVGEESNLDIMLDDDLRRAVEKSNKDSSDMLGNLLK